MWRNREAAQLETRAQEWESIASKYLKSNSLSLSEYLGTTYVTGTEPIKKLITSKKKLVESMAAAYAKARITGDKQTMTEMRNRIIKINNLVKDLKLILSHTEN
ncbi:hypothetical protein KKG83_01230 [Candidatus Micrarchaeota archaeon]|nr:hypothetical protein [Candidatus Micrarchaeota archaeon]MBU2476071.1 hypothetical protein [Candidatus Micrarchaeota archaeon]